MKISPLPYKRIILIDFEFTAPPGERQTPICCVLRDLRDGSLHRHWLVDDWPEQPPFDTGPDTLFVAYYASAELGCFLELDWPLPVRILDLYVEFRCLTSGLPLPGKRGLLGAMSYYGIDGLAAVEKESMRQLAIRGAPFTAEERIALLDYCQADVDALAKLLPAMLGQIDLPQALLRGRYMAAVARMEWHGIPIDTRMLGTFREHWTAIKSRLIAEVDQDFGVFVPTGQRRLNPETAFGAAVLETAEEWGLDPHHLADAVDMIWREERDSTADLRAARKTVRERTGLTAKKMSAWEDAGKDSSLFPGLDAQARYLAGEFPELCIGTGYRTDDGIDDNDYAADLWEKLRKPEEPLKRRYDSGILRQAAEMVSACPKDRQVYFGPMTFSSELWENYLAKKDIPWPRLESGAIALDDDTFREMARAYPIEVAPIRELRHTLSQMRLQDLAVGNDGRNRTLLSAFSSRTSRNQPSNTKFIFGPSTWTRALIKPGPGRAVAYLDWSQQELAIAAYLSGDLHMQDAYKSGDFYLDFGKRAGAIPADATKESHGKEREQFKVVSLGVLYGLSAEGLARKLNVQSCRGRELLQMHQETFRQFWRWSDQVEVQGVLGGRLESVFGWMVHAGKDANPRSMRNFPMQANGAEMMRLACCAATEQGIKVCCPVHDALLIEAPISEIETAVQRTQQIMREASALVLPGFPLRSDAKIVRYPDRYMDPRGRTMWTTVQGILKSLNAESEMVMT